MIRAIESHEIYKILPICRDFFEAAQEIGTFNDDFFVKQWKYIIESNQGIIFVKFDGQEVKGVFSCIVCQEDTTGDWTIQEKFWYGDATLFSYVMKWAKRMKEMGIKSMYLSHTNHLTPDKLEEFYKRQGFIGKYTRYAKEL